MRQQGWASAWPPAASAVCVVCGRCGWCGLVWEYHCRAWQGLVSEVFMPRGGRQQAGGLTAVPVSRMCHALCCTEGLLSGSADHSCCVCGATGMCWLESHGLATGWLSRRHVAPVCVVMCVPVCVYPCWQGGTSRGVWGSCGPKRASYSRRAAHRHSRCVSICRGQALASNGLPAVVLLHAAWDGLQTYSCVPYACCHAALHPPRWGAVPQQPAVCRAKGLSGLACCCMGRRCWLLSGHPKGGEGCWPPPVVMLAAQPRLLYPVPSWHLLSLRCAPGRPLYARRAGPGRANSFWAPASIFNCAKHAPWCMAAGLWAVYAVSRTGCCGGGGGCTGVCWVFCFFVCLWLSVGGIACAQGGLALSLGCLWWRWRWLAVECASEEGRHVASGRGTGRAVWQCGRGRPHLLRGGTPAPVPGDWLAVAAGPCSRMCCRALQQQPLKPACSSSRGSQREWQCRAAPGQPQGPPPCPSPAAAAASCTVALTEEDMHS
jgi:hypothetical protein